jgi:peptidoglycan/LPS O-acetylase OafA/YrhL
MNSRTYFAAFERYEEYDSINILNGIRLLLAIGVLFSHSFELMVNGRSYLSEVLKHIQLGRISVDLFFALSGFLILRSWLRNPHWSAFLRNRCLRIYPAFTCAYLFSILISFVIGAIHPIQYFQAGGNFIAVVSDVILLREPHVSLNTYQALGQPSLNGSLWTIRFEFGCYVAALILGVTGALARPWMVLVVWLAATLSFLALRIEGELGTLTYVLRFLTLFFSGMVAYIFRVHRHRTIAPLLACALILVFGMNTPVLFDFSIATAGCYLMLRLGYLTGFTWPLPDFSYGAYLYGWPVQLLVLHQMHPINGWALFAGSAPLAVLLGLGSWFGVERPFIALKANLPRGSVVPA